MAGWTSDELDKIGSAEELDLESMRQDGTLRKPVTMWVVRIGGDLYIRAVKGRAGPWFKGTQSRREGRIRSGGVEKDVAFVDETGPEINNQIDAAYRAKYRKYPSAYVDDVLTPQARQATLKLVPRSGKAPY